MRERNRFPSVLLQSPPLKPFGGGFKSCPGERLPTSVRYSVFRFSCSLRRLDRSEHPGLLQFFLERRRLTLRRARVPRAAAGGKTALMGCSDIVVFETRACAGCLFVYRVRVMCGTM